MIRFSSSIRHVQMMLATVCSIVFLVFSFAYLYLMHGEVMRCLWMGLKGEGASYSPLWGALLITVVLWILRWILDLFTKFSRTCLAISYFPAYWSLALLTYVCPITTEEGVSGPPMLEICDGWWWLPVLLILYFVIGFFNRKQYTILGKRTLLELLIFNLLTLILFSYSVGSIGNNNELFHHELRVSQYIHDQRYDDALAVGKKSLHNTHSLTSMRALALSHSHLLGESLFAYPQSNKSNGLFFAEDKQSTCRFSNEDIELHLGGIARLQNESVINYLKRVYELKTGNQYVLDYYLCALLLEKQLGDFYQALVDYWPKDSVLPRHYQEALLIAQEDGRDNTRLISLCNKDIQERYAAFLQLKAEHANPLWQNNYTRRKFGDTYWWYYWYGE